MHSTEGNILLLLQNRNNLQMEYYYLAEGELIPNRIEIFEMLTLLEV